MTFNTKIGDFMDFLAILGCKTHFKSELLCMKFSALNVDYDSPSL